MSETIQYIGNTFAYALGYGIFALVAFSIAFVLSKTLKTNWPYIVALVLTIIFYAMVVTGNAYLNRGA